MVGTKTIDLTNKKKHTIKITNKEVTFNKTKRTVSKLAKLDKKNTTIYIIFFSDEQDYWMISKGLKTEHVIFVQDYETEETTHIHGINKK